MKRFIAILLVFVLTLGAVFALSSCAKNDTEGGETQDNGTDKNNGESGDAANSQQTTGAESTTSGNSLIDENGQILSFYNDDMTFELPENYMKLDTAVAAYFDTTSANELTVLYTDAITLYDDMTTELFETMFKESYEADGSVFSEASVSVTEIDEVPMTHISYLLEKDGVKTYNTQYIMTIGTTTYFINITETEPEGELSKRVLDTLTVLNKKSSD